MTTRPEGQIRIKNWDKYQATRKDRNSAPWIKLHKTFWSDFHVRKLDLRERAILIGIFTFAEHSTGEILVEEEELMYLMDCKSIPWDKLGRWFEAWQPDDDHWLPIGCQDVPSRAGESKSKNKSKSKSGHADQTVASVATFRGQKYFENFWEQYPRKTGQREAFKAWVKMFDGIDNKYRQGLHDEVMEGLAAFLLTEDVVLNRKQYIPHCKTWINQGRWDDENEAFIPEATRKATEDAGGTRVLTEAECDKLGIPYE